MNLLVYWQEQKEGTKKRRLVFRIINNNIDSMFLLQYQLYFINSNNVRYLHADNGNILCNKDIQLADMIKLPWLFTGHLRIVLCNNDEHIFNWGYVDNVRNSYLLNDKGTWKTEVYLLYKKNIESNEIFVIKNSNEAIIKVD